jgi:hypothetical protein
MNGDLLADSHNILNRWKYFFPLVAEPGASCIELELAVEKLKKSVTR